MILLQVLVSVDLTNLTFFSAHFGILFAESLGPKIAYSIVALVFALATDDDEFLLLIEHTNFYL